MIARVLLFAVVAVLAFGSIGAFAQSGRKTIVLIFPIKLTGVSFSEGQRVQLRDYLDTRLTMEGVYKVMPESQIKKDLGVAKVQSYNDCYDEACRIDLTKTVYADRSVSVEVSAETKTCRVTAKLYDIAQEATEAAADVITGCDFDSVKLCMVAVAQQLSGKASPVAIQQVQGGDGTFSIAALPAMPKVTAVGQVQVETGGQGSWNDIDVAAYEAYDLVLLKDSSSSVSPEDKIKAWESLGGKFPGFAAQATTRASQWRRHVAEKAEAERVGSLRRQRMEEDWSKLSRLLKLKVFDDARKKAWAELFVEAYGDDTVVNPYFIQLIPWLASEGNARTKWIRIPGGTFQMGSNNGSSDEKPVHSVSVRAFEMARTEVAVWQYQQCVDAGACSLPGTGSGCNWGVSGKQDHPVNCVDWGQAMAYAKWVGGRLPTEAEWEFAASGGGQNRMYPWGNDKATCRYAVMDDGRPGCGSDSTSSVCSKPDGNTVHGLCDMSGNVWEWVQDKYHDSNSGASSKGLAWGGASSSRVFRGGSCYDTALFLRVAGRDSSTPGGRGARVGFRVARDAL